LIFLDKKLDREERGKEVKREWKEMKGATMYKKSSLFNLYS
jgi:hypothetical protein